MKLYAAKVQIKRYSNMIAFLGKKEGFIANLV